MKSELFGSTDYVEIQKRVLELINASPDFLSKSTANSPRAVGDAIENIVIEAFEKILGIHCKKYFSSFARRDMADLAFKDKNGVYYIVDVKTHRTETKFNMPNLTSVERIAKFYEEDEKNEKDSKFFTVLFISYNISGLKVEVSNVIFAPIEYISWKCLTIGALGWGQIQIVNSNEILLKHGYSRKQWMLELCDVMLKFYPKEIEKIGKRISRFQTVKSSWENKIE